MNQDVSGNIPPKGKVKTDIREAAARKLAISPMSSAELEKYLLKKNFDNDDVCELISEYIDNGYLNDSRYCLDYFRYAYGKRKAKMRIFAELRKKGIDRALIEKAHEEYMNDYPVDELEMAREEAAKILRISVVNREDRVSEKIKGRVARKLNAYGYPSHLIYEILDEIDSIEF